jgi:hypothetical protein
MPELETRHIDAIQHATNQVALLSGGGLVASVSLLLPLRPLPDAGLLITAWTTMAAATVLGALSNYANSFSVTYQMKLHYEDVDPTGSSAKLWMCRRDFWRFIGTWGGHAAMLMFIVGAISLSRWACVLVAGPALGAA